MERRQRTWLQRVVALVLSLIAVPLVMMAAVFGDEAPIRLGEPSPRTVIAPEAVRVVDQAATERARRVAMDAVESVLVFDPAAQAEVVTRVRDAFAAAAEVRRPGSGGPDGQAVVPSTADQVEALTARLTFIQDPAVLSALVAVPTGQLAAVEDETVQIAQELARQRIRAEDLESRVNEVLSVELALRDFPGATGAQVAAPIIRFAMQPTVRVDQAQTQARRDAAAAEVEEVSRTFPAGSTIVRAGQEVDELQFQALEQSGLVGTDRARLVLTAFGSVALILIVVTGYLRLRHNQLLRSGRRVLLLAILFTGYSLLTVGVGFVADATSNGAWWYAVPAGGLAMLISLLLGPYVAAVAVLPAAVLPVLLAPRGTPIAVFTISAVLVSIPLVSHIDARNDLRKAAWRGVLAFTFLAFVVAALFDSRDAIGWAMVAGAANGVLSAVLVSGVLPFLESSFRIATVTTLLDLADRNHPLLRELESKALGSYNHSVMVATLVERACRRIGANPLLGSVASLYHDIGKVVRPHFFIENQQGIANPHDDVEPEVSARIIIQHVEDGVEMAREYHLPPEVVSAIGSHHGTTLVKYFYAKALERAESTGEQVDESDYRYHGHKPRRKEAVVLFLADSCEASTRAAAMARGTLSREEIEEIVAGLFDDRIDDAQLSEADLTFAELTAVRESFIEALVGIYHPRIAYPKASRPEKPTPPQRVTAS